MAQNQTVAELTVLYKGQPLTRLIFDKQETADNVVKLITKLFNEKGRKEFSFKGELKQVYTPDGLFEELFDFLDGETKPKGTLLEMMQAIDGLN